MNATQQNKLIQMLEMKNIIDHYKQLFGDK